jgi:SPP1 family predicted phage head-tail adaptor
MRAGRLRNRCEFQRPVVETSPTGNQRKGWESFMKVWGDLLPQRGREQIEAGRLESQVPGTLQIRFSSVAAQIDASYRVTIGGEPYQIRSVMDPDMRRRIIEMVVERGVAT